MKQPNYWLITIGAMKEYFEPLIWLHKQLCEIKINMYWLLLMIIILYGCVIGLLCKVDVWARQNENNQPQVVKMRVEFMNNGQMMSYPLGNDYKLVEDK